MNAGVAVAPCTLLHAEPCRNDGSYDAMMRCVDVMGRRAWLGSASPVRSCQTWT